MSSRCAECHTTKGFEIVEGRTFNHALTKYPLKGGHGRVSCDGCHGPNLVKRNPAFERCENCHSDPHNGKSGIDGQTGRLRCVPSRRRFRAQFLHRGPACVVAVSARGTSRPGGVREVSRRIAHTCRCEASAHRAGSACRSASAPTATRTHMAGNWRRDADRGACEGCHAVAGWTPSTFSVAKHGSLRLRLEGRHAEIPCRACHGGTRAGLPAPAPPSSLGHAAVAVTLAGSACGDCHVDAHAGRYGRAGALPTDGDCGACHSATSFRPSLVDGTRHDRFSFQLKGAHRAVACVSCHEELGAKPADVDTAAVGARCHAFPGRADDDTKLRDVSREPARRAIREPQSPVVRVVPRRGDRSPRPRFSTTSGMRPSRSAARTRRSPARVVTCARRSVVS